MIATINQVPIKWVLVMLAVTVLAFSSIAAVTPLGERMNALAVTIAGDVVCSQCVGTNGDGTNDIKDGSVTNSKIASSAVTKSKLAVNSVDGGKISDGTISAADLGPDSVGASELKGVSKFLFAQCTITYSGSIGSGVYIDVPCSLVGTDSDDSAIATLNSGDICFAVSRAIPQTDSVIVSVRNECPISVTVGTLAIGLMVYDK